jgi:hypothetical protein
MPTKDEKTLTFDVWPNLLIIEGPTRVIGMLISILYEDKSMPRDGWTVTHNEHSRKTYADVLKRGGEAKKRQGMGVRDAAFVEIVEHRAKALGLSCFRFKSKTKGAI